MKKPYNSFSTKLSTQLGIGMDGILGSDLAAEEDAAVCLKWLDNFTLVNSGHMKSF